MEKKDTYLKKNAFDTAIKYLPRAVGEAALGYLSDSGVSKDSVGEIRLRYPGASQLVVSGKNVSLDVKLEREDLKESFKLVCGGAVFAHRDDVCRGFACIDGGIRVGVCGRAGYENGRIVGVSDISALVFRIPSGKCSFARALYREWLRGEGGMLICSRAGEGKTTALRSLASLIGSGDGARRVVVVDERCEFLLSDYEGTSVDVLRGYRRALGVDIAVRTMSAEVMIVDEISSREDADAMLAAVGAGVTVIATVHADGIVGAVGREYVARLVFGGLFSRVCTLSRSGSHFGYRLEKIDVEQLKKLHGMGDICRI